jgi:hypothetical protein
MHTMQRHAVKRMDKNFFIIVSSVFYTGAGIPAWFGVGIERLSEQVRQSVSQQMHSSSRPRVTGVARSLFSQHRQEGYAGGSSGVNS